MDSKCILHKYNDPMDYDFNSMTQAANIEKIFSEYFHNVKAILRRTSLESVQHVSERSQVIHLY